MGDRVETTTDAMAANAVADADAGTGADKVKPGGKELPLVTFALFAYNQEKYIREAIEGAFSQTYEPLEIILSDDCSTDRTFEIMQEMAAGYRGPHKVVVRREFMNCGLVSHFMNVTHQAEGKYMVVAAGDDISHPDRTTRLIELMIQNEARAATSNANIMDTTGAIDVYDFSHDNSEHYLWRIVNSSGDFFINGAVAAYETEFILEAFKFIESLVNECKMYYEDTLLSAYAVATNCKPTVYVAGPLVNYRINNNSISNFNPGSGGYSAELALVRNERFRASSRLNLLYAIETLATALPTLGAITNWERLSKDKRLSLVELAASDPSLWRRIKGLTDVQNFHELRVAVARIFGERTHARIRSLYWNYQR